MKLAMPLAAVLALTLAACGSNSEPVPTETASDTALETPVAALTAQDFVNSAAASDLYETEAGKLAQENGRSQEVKDFGAMMVKDHAGSTEALKAATAESQQPVTVAAKLQPDQERKLEQLRGAGGNFDALYSLQQVGAHEAALKLLQDYAANGSEAGLRDFSSKTAKAVEKHLDEARKL